LRFFGRRFCSALIENSQYADGGHQKRGSNAYPDFCTVTVLVAFFNDRGRGHDCFSRMFARNISMPLKRRNQAMKPFDLFNEFH
jgi:hypothetical protein